MLIFWMDCLLNDRSWFRQGRGLNKKKNEITKFFFLLLNYQREINKYVFKTACGCSFTFRFCRISRSCRISSLSCPSCNDFNSDVSFSQLAQRALLTDRPFLVSRSCQLLFFYFYFIFSLHMS